MFQNHQQLLLFILSSAFVASTHAQTVLDDTIMHNGLEREYRLYVPDSYDGSEPVPLVFNLHGFGIHNHEQEVYADLRAIADTANFIIVLPNGTLDDGGYRFWNAFGIPGLDDLGFLVSLIDTLSAEYAIDQDRIYSTGMSLGGMMSYELACYASERFAAIASVTGTMLPTRLGGCSPTHAMPVLQIHGTEDPIIPYEGNENMVGVEQVLGHWLQYDLCEEDPMITALPDLDPDDGSTVEHHVFACELQDTAVELYKVIGGGHTWPGSVINNPGTNHDFDASIAIWEFFLRFDLEGLTTTAPGMNSGDAIEIFPNPSSEHFTLRARDAAYREVTVIDSRGSIVLRSSSTATETPIMIGTPGLYTVIVQEDAGSSIHRVVRH